MSDFPPIIEAAIDHQNAIQALESEVSEKSDEITALKNTVKKLEDDLDNCTFEIGCLREGFDPTTGRDLVFTKPEGPPLPTTPKEPS